MHVPLTEVILSHDGVELARATLPPGEYVIGREAGVDLHAVTPLLSRQHARLTINYDHLVIEDLGSSNGTFVNERPLTANETTRLFPNQSIRLGDVTLEVNRQRTPSEPGVSLPPAQEAIRRHLPEEMLGDKRYAIVGIVAQGGMGAILDARQTAIDRTVAMKVMLESADEAAVLRFIDEAKITGQLDHPNIVPIYELGVDEQGQLFYTMKFVRGITLKKVLELLADGTAATLKEYPLPVLLTIFQKVCDALAFAHSKGVIHRDLKPENLMLGDFGSVLVMDWGLAKVVGKTGAPGTDIGLSSIRFSRAAEPAHGSTMAGAIMGTPQYMAPEQARGESETLDARSDIYALGAILFHLLALRPSVTGGSAMEIVDKVGRGEIERLPLAGHPDSLVAVVHKAMAFDRAARYATVAALQADIAAFQGGFATSAEGAGLARQLFLGVMRHKAVAAAVAIALLTGAGFGTKAVVEGRRAERALAELKKSAPGLRQLAESEAGFQRFDSALEKLDGAIGLAPEHLPAYWRRAWLLFGMERFADSAAAIRVARQKDPARAQLADILPVVEKLANASSEAEGWASASTPDLYRHLQKVGASGEIAALSRHLQIGTQERLKLVSDRVHAWLGPGVGLVRAEADGGILVNNIPHFVNTIEPLKSLPISALELDGTQVESLEPLRGMTSLRWLSIGYCPVTDLSPLRGLQLRRLNLCFIKGRDLSQLAGLPLDELNAHFNTETVTGYSALKGAPLRVINVGRSGADDLSFLADSPIEDFSMSFGGRDISVLHGKPLRRCIIHASDIKDLSPLIDTPLGELVLSICPKIRDLTPLLRVPGLEKLTVCDLKVPLDPLRSHPSLKFIQVKPINSEADAPFVPVAQFWKQYDAQQK